MPAPLTHWLPVSSYYVLANTKNIDLIQAQEKIYTGTIKIGATTPTYDMESES
jgi:tRNA U55 pseudouridine synthase TruB